MTMTTTTEQLKTLALAIHLEESPDASIRLEGDYYELGRTGWYIYTDKEADQAWDESLDNYLDECVLDQLPKIAQSYFDREAWKKDAKCDGRGHSLSGWDGEEHEVTLPVIDSEVYGWNDGFILRLAERLISSLNDDMGGEDEESAQEFYGILADALQDAGVNDNYFIRKVKDGSTWALWLLSNGIECDGETFYLFRQN